MATGCWETLAVLETFSATNDMICDKWIIVIVISTIYTHRKNHCQHSWLGWYTSSKGVIMLKNTAGLVVLRSRRKNIEMDLLCFSTLWHQFNQNPKLVPSRASSARLKPEMQWFILLLWFSLEGGWNYSKNHALVRTGNVMHDMTVIKKWKDYVGIQ